MECSCKDFFDIQQSGYRVHWKLRPAVHQLPFVPQAAFSSADGACLLVFYTNDSAIRLAAYHWTSLGKPESEYSGFVFDLGGKYPDSILATSIMTRSKCHFVLLDLDGNLCHSYFLEITRQVTEFTFREKYAKSSQRSNRLQTEHNCLIDCYQDIWTRYPVVPAIKREAIALASRKAKTITFISECEPTQFVTHFSHLVTSFERKTKKPTDNVLRKIEVHAMPFNTFMETLQSSDAWISLSSFKFGEWVVDIFCLIPIHVAIARDNRFIPLKDGVLDASLEKSLLGAEVDKIIDVLSLGWYESIFRSYMATKVRASCYSKPYVSPFTDFCLQPVRVVSSMGEFCIPT